MPSTRTLQQTVDYARTFAQLVPIVGVGGFSNEPALSICNNVLQEILSPPFNWKFNRASLTAFDTVENQQEYVMTGVTDIGWLERCVIEFRDTDATPKPRTQIEVVYSLPLTSEVGVPCKVCVDREEGNDTILRLWPMPSSTVYTIYIDYQKKAPTKTALTETWSPIPDEIVSVCDQGFLAAAFKFANDKRYLAEYQQFQILIRKALGLKDSENRSEVVYPERGLLLG